MGALHCIALLTTVSRGGHSAFKFRQYVESLFVGGETDGGQRILWALE